MGAGLPWIGPGAKLRKRVTMDVVNPTGYNEQHVYVTQIELGMRENRNRKQEPGELDLSRA
jgi:hypothetical protein